MTVAERNCWIEQADAGAVLYLAGPWRVEALADLEQALAAALAGGSAPGRVDGSGVSSIDTAGALVVLRGLTLAGANRDELEFIGFADHHRRVIALVSERFEATTAVPARRRHGWLVDVGKGAIEVGQIMLGHISFLGLIATEFGRLLRNPGALRVRELFVQLGRTGVSAIPVIALLTFLIGVIVAYLLGIQAEQFGANIYVVDGVALGMVREFSPLIVATIVAGRSGAAFTAQLGTMKLTEEIDALRTLGLSAEQVLVIPRVLALMLALPLLVFVGNVAGLWGALVVSDLMLDITPFTFIDRLHSALAPRHYVIGLAKSPVFAIAIAVIGCRMGFAVARDTRAIGESTTSTVVQCIVTVIVLDALFAVLFQELGL